MWYVTSGQYRVVFEPTPALVLEYGREGVRDVVSSERLKEQVGTAFTRPC